LSCCVLHASIPSVRRDISWPVEGYITIKVFQRGPIHIQEGLLVSAKFDYSSLQLVVKFNCSKCQKLDLATLTNTCLLPQNKRMCQCNAFAVRVTMFKIMAGLQLRMYRNNTSILQLLQGQIRKNSVSRTYFTCPSFNYSRT
jgi:hypothetical protein